MREYSVPDLVPLPDPGTNMAHAVVRHLREAPDAVLLSRLVGDRWEQVTARAFAAEVAGLAKGLVAAGITPGDRVGLMSSTRYEWTLLDYAIWTAGGVTVPIYETSAAEQVRWILDDSGACAVFTETDRHAALVEQVRADLPALANHWTIDGPDLPALVRSGAEVTDQTLDERRASRGLHDVATIVYTSGTTGRPKGCELTHLNLWWTALSAARILPELFNENGSTLLFLPLAHIFGRLIQGICVENRVHLAHTNDLPHLVKHLETFSPTFLLSVPRVFEKVYNTYKETAHAAGKGRIFDRAEDVAIAYSRALDSGRPGPLLSVQHKVFDKILYGPKLRAPLGGSLRYAVSGGAPLGERLGHFFRGIGVTICEGYGLTETSAAGSVNTLQALRIGSIGRPSPGCAVRIAEGDDEILIKGRSVFAGYWGDAATSGAGDGGGSPVDADGWFHTGDVGRLDDDGFLYVTGRKKELIVTAGGKNVAPAPLEDRIRSHPLVSQAMVVGDNERFIAALVTLDEESLGRWAKSRGLAAEAGAYARALHDDPAVRAEIQTAVDAANASVSKAEAVREFVILPEDFSEAGGTLTPSLKVKRNVVLQRYAAEIARLYGR